MQSTISAKGVINFILVGLFLFFEMGLQVTPNVIATPLMRDLQLQATGLSFLSSVYFYSYSLMMIPVGILYDRFSANKLLVVALIVLSIGNLLFATLHSFGFLVLARLLMGFGSAFAFIGVLVIAKTWFPNRYFALLVGMTQLMAALGGAFGETPVAYLVSQIGWRQSMLIFAVVAIVLALIIALVIRPQKNHKLKTHLSLSEILHSIIFLLRKPQTFALAIYALLSWGPVVVFAELWGASFLQARYHISTAQASMSAIAMWLGIAMSAPVLGYLSRYIAHRVLMSLTLLIAFISSIALLYLPGISFTFSLVAALFLGLGSAAQILSFDVVRANNSGDQFGISIGFNNLGVVLSGALLQPLAGILLQWHSHVSPGQHYPVEQFYQALWLIPACFLFAWLISKFWISYKAIEASKAHSRPS